LATLEEILPHHILDLEEFPQKLCRALW